VENVMVVEVDGLFDQPEPQRAGCEIEIGLRLVHGGRHVVQAENWE
jgi:hypothetical protein